MVGLGFLCNVVIYLININTEYLLGDKIMVDKSFTQVLEGTVKQKWNCLVISEYPGKSLKYRDLARDIATIQNFLKKNGATKGTKIAICARNSANWISLYFAITISGFVAVLLPTNLSASDLVYLVNFSDCDFLFVDKDNDMLNRLNNFNVPLCIFDIESLLPITTQEIVSNNEQDIAFDILRNQVKIRRDEVKYCGSEPDDVCTIVYTSGSTTSPKGVMLSERNISSHLHCFYECTYAEGEKCHVNAVLPFSHIFGLLVDAILPVCFGIRIAILRLQQTGQNISAISLKYKPKYFLTVPIVVEQLLNYHIGKELDDLKDLIITGRLDEKSITSHYINLGKKVREGLGGKFNLFYSGGASLSGHLIELLRRLQIPIISGYGTTECGFVTIGVAPDKHSSGKIYESVNITIDSKNEYEVPGEILIKGDNVFKGYYKNQSATKAVFTEDGWFKTGDLGYIDEEGNLFVTGRCKDMLLTSNGVNIYPEDIEVAMNASLYIKESILVQRGEKLYAIVVPDREKVEADGLDAEGLNKKIDEAVREASKKLPGFTIISGYELHVKPLERTPKGSLKRYLYS